MLCCGRFLRIFLLGWSPERLVQVKVHRNLALRVKERDLRPAAVLGQGVVSNSGNSSVVLEGDEGDEIWGLLTLMARTDEICEQSIAGEEVSLLARHTFTVAQAYHAARRRSAAN